jgi:predicted neuraminidase
MMRYFLLAIMGSAFLMAVLRMAGQPPSSQFLPTLIQTVPGSKPFFTSGFASTGKTRLVHAPAMVELGDGRIMAFWFAGSREGAADVVIHSSVYSPNTMKWAEEKTVTSRLRTQTDVHRYVRKLGNPVPIRDAAGKLWLFYVSAVGGWSTSAINLMTSADEGEHWSRARRLVTSPFLNLSTLVKTPPFFFRDGTLGLPVYHEMLGKFSELLRLDKNGKVISKQRLSYGRQTLQPLLLIENEHDALALMRYAGPPPRRARQVASQDGGKHWSALEPSELPNPDSAMAGVTLAGGSLLVILNHNEVRRDELSLVLSNDKGRHWRVLYRFEDERRWRGLSFSAEAFTENTMALVQKTDATIEDTEEYISAVRDTMCKRHPCRFQFDYPYLIQAGNGMFHLLYTWNRAYIKHVQFNQAWLEARRVNVE